MTLSRFLPAAHFASLSALSRRVPGAFMTRARRGQWIALVAILLATLSVIPLADAQINVNTTAQGVTSGQCSLQEAIYAAEFGSNIALDQTDPDDTYYTGCSDATGSWNTIVLPGGTLQFDHFWDGDGHNPFGPTATPIIFTSITILGNGTTLQWIGTGQSRMFAIGYASITPTSGVVTGITYSGTGNLTLRHVYVKDFKVHGGHGACGGGGGLGAGGAIYVGKTSSGVPALTVENSTFQGNSATGGDGSYADGGVCGLDPSASNEPAGGGGGGLSGNGAGFDTSGAGGGGGGARGDGGAGLSKGGGGGGGTVFTGGSSYVGGPGGLYCGGNGGDHQSNGHDGSCPGGGGGGGGPDGTNSSSSGGKGNYAGGGGGGGVTAGSGGDGGFGGGGGSAGLNNCFLCIPSGGNGGFGGGGGDNGAGGNNGNGGAFGGNGTGFNGGGGGALGGAIFNDSGAIVIQNSTFVANLVQAGNGGSKGIPNNDPGADGSDSGGAIFSRNGSLTVQNVTISGNRASVAGGGIEVMNDGGTTILVLDNTIIANNGSQECITKGTVATSNSGTNSAANLIMSNGGCPAVTLTSDPQLGLLLLNSPGDTPTMAIQYGTSPAVDAGDDSTALPTDQRGVTRPQGPHSDIGAYEAPPPSADLGIVKTVSSAVAQPGDTVTYMLAVNNAGPNTANSVTVTDALPTQLTFVSCTADAGGVCTFSGGTVSVAYATLANGASSTVSINTTLNSGVTDGLTVGNSASVSAASPTDPNTSNNSSTAYFTIHNRADLAVTKTGSTTSPYAPQVEVGDPLTYTVTLTNKGPYDARGVALSDSAPAGETFTGCTSTVGTCVWSATSASLSLSSFTNGSTATITIQATLNFGVADGSTVTNMASVSSTTFDPNLSNNSASASFTALNNSDLAVSQSATKLPNRQLQYTVNVKNLGKYLAKQLLLTDAVPNGTYLVSITPGAWTCSAPPIGSVGTISCTLPTEAVNTTQTLMFVVKVKTPGNVLISNTANVSAATFDPNTANNASTLASKVGP